MMDRLLTLGTFATVALLFPVIWAVTSRDDRPVAPVPPPA